MLRPCRSRRATRASGRDWAPGAGPRRWSPPEPSSPQRPGRRADLPKDSRTGQPASVPRRECGGDAGSTRRKPPSPSSLRPHASSAREMTAASSSAANGSDARVSQARAASMSAGMSSPRRGGLKAHLRSARRTKFGSGAPGRGVTSAVVTAVSPSTRETLPLPGCLGQRASMKSQACSYQVTRDV